MSSDHLDFFFASLQSKQPRTARKVHIRRLYDILQLCIQRQDFTRARRAWAILARCKEIQWKSLWMTSLLLVGDGVHDVDSSKDKVNYLRSLMLQHLDDREAILTELIHCLIVSGRYREALDELELYLPSFLYQDNPILHVYAGLLCLYLSQEATEGTTCQRTILAKSHGADVSRSSQLLREARSHLEHAKELDPDSATAELFIQKIDTMGQNYHSQADEADSDQEHMAVDENSTPKSKRARTSPNQEPE